MINIPNLPDNLGKVYFSISVILLGFSFYSIYFPSDNDKELIQKLKVDFLNVSDELFIVAENQKRTELKIFNIAEIKSKELKIENKLKVNSDTLEISRYSLCAMDLHIQDTISPYFEDLSIIKSHRRFIEKKRDYIQNQISNIEYNFSKLIGSIGGLVLGLFFMTFGLKKWNEESNKEKTSPGEKPTVEYEILCESCARNFTFYLNRGTEKNGEESKLFCSDCYEGGEFTDYLTDDNFNAYRAKIIESRKFGRDRRRIKRRFKLLIRWKTDEYEKLS